MRYRFPRRFNSSARHLAKYSQHRNGLERQKKTLEESVGRLNMALEATSTGLWDIELTGARKVYLSDSYYRMLGYEPGEFEASLESWYALMPEEDRIQMQSTLEQQLRSGLDDLEIYHRLRTKDGLFCWILGKGKVIARDAGGNPVRILGVNLDLTLPRGNEMQLELHSRRADALLEIPKAAEYMNEIELLQFGLELVEQLTGSPVSFIHLVDHDAETIELVAWSKATLSRYCTAVFNQHYPIAEAGIWADSFRKKAPVIVNDYASAPNKKGMPEGHAYLVRFVSLPIIEGQRVHLLAGMGNKVTDYTAVDVDTLQLITNELWRIVRKQRAENELRKLSMAVEQSPVSILITDLSGMVEYVNQQYLKTSGYSRDEILETCTGLCRRDSLTHEMTQALNAAMAEGHSWKGKCVNRRKDGSEYTELVLITPIRQLDGSIRHYLEISEDITEFVIMREGTMIIVTTSLINTMKRVKNFKFFTSCFSCASW